MVHNMCAIMTNWHHKLDSRGKHPMYCVRVAWYTICMPSWPTDIINWILEVNTQCIVSGWQYTMVHYMCAIMTNWHHKLDYKDKHPVVLSQGGTTQWHAISIQDGRFCHTMTWGLVFSINSFNKALWMHFLALCIQAFHQHTKVQTTPTLKVEISHLSSHLPWLKGTCCGSSSLAH